MSALDQPKRIPLVVQIGPHRKLEAELRQQLEDRNLQVDKKKPLHLDTSTRSTLEAFLWRDIQYFLGKEYSESKAVDSALDRLRMNPVFVETVESLVCQFSKEEGDDG